MSHVILREGLAVRLKSLARRKKIARGSEAAVARLVVSLAHDWALGGVLSPGTASRPNARLLELVDVAWEGIRPPRIQPRRPRSS